ncbi:prohead core scaffold protein [uncultured Mediterranean phage]|nr:prohead core scaffold protein [uncultured Mediterranean phage]
MSRGKKLQEMDESVANPSVSQSKTAVNANAKPGDPMPKLTTGGTAPSYEDLGGPTPENYKVDDDSAKLKTPGASLKQVSDVVTNRKGKMKAEETEVSDEVIEEEEQTTEEVVAEEETVEETVEVNIEDDVNALLGGEELSEEFREKAKLVFETALNSKVSEIHEALEAKYQETLEEKIEAEKAALSERVDNYLEYVADEWFNENALAVEQGLKTDMTESFLEGMRGLFEEHYVSIPEDKYDVLESMVEKLDDMETKLNEQIEKNVGLNSRLGESVANGILESVSDGLASTQKEKLASLAESVEFESEESYREKLETLRESYFTSQVTPTAKSESLSEGVDISPENATGSMSAYLKTLSAFKQS